MTHFCAAHDEWRTSSGELPEFHAGGAALGPADDGRWSPTPRSAALDVGRELALALERLDDDGAPTATADDAGQSWAPSAPAR
jgi:hypothetical protein